MTMTIIVTKVRPKTNMILSKKLFDLRKLHYAQKHKRNPFQ